MPEMNKNDLAYYRIQTSEEKLRSAEILFREGMYKDSIGRAYYSIFSATRAVLALDGVDFSKHSAVIAYFQKNYIKQNIFDKKYSKIISTSFIVRNHSDYDDMYIASKEEASLQLESAKFFLEGIKKYLNEKQLR